MGLKDYLTEQGLSVRAFADLAGRPHATVSKWVYGQRVPRFAAAREIERLTGGKVSIVEQLGARVAA